MDKILVVDDEERIVKLLQVNLQKAGYDVVSASNGNEALNIIKKEKPDLIILDIMMPEMDGIEALRKLKQDKKTKKIPVVMLTCKSEDKDIFCGWKEGADAYLTKPFEPAEVIIMVKGILRDLRMYGEK
jgi:two-component system alkaline phosphatase synthesis response regulator PhoP/two-component system response regulator VicR